MDGTKPKIRCSIQALHAITPKESNEDGKRTINGYTPPSFIAPAANQMLKGGFPQNGAPGKCHKVTQSWLVNN